MSTDAHALPSNPTHLKALLLRERQQHGQVVAQHQQIVVQYEETVQSQQKKLCQLEHRLAQLLRRYYGPKQERIDPDQLMLFSQDELQQLIEELSSDNSPQEPITTDDRKKRRPGHGRRSLPGHLPREQVTYELSEAERACPGCGQLRQEIGSQTSEQLEVVPAQVKVIEHVRKKYACRACEEHVAIAPQAASTD